MALPKWAEAVAGLSFLVVVVRCFASGRFQPAIQTALMLMLYPLTGFVSAIAGAPDPAFADSAAQIEQYLHGLCSFVSTGVPFLVALTLLMTPDMQRRLMGDPAH
jgi:EamA domain-containing membrane protein RarD